MGINFGATFNLAHGLDQMLHRRVPHRAPFADGMWFVGGGTHPGSGLPVIFLSAQITAGMLCDELGVPGTEPRAASARGAGELVGV
jgi:phytoene desaturase